MDTQTLRPAVLHHLVKSLGTPSQLNVQKVSYLLQEGLGVPTNYRFKMHHQGPISNKLTDVMDWMKTQGYLEIWADPGGPGYLVIVRRDAESEWEPTRKAHENHLEAILNSMGHRPHKYVELLATVHYVRRIESQETREKILSTVGAMGMI